jgi:hypothetical protein
MSDSKIENHEDEKGNRPETLLIATEVLDKIAMHVSFIYANTGPLRTALQQASYGSSNFADHFEDAAGAVLRLLEVIGADLPRPAPPARETIAREARLRKDSVLWSATMSGLKAALPHGISPDHNDHDQ